MGFYRDHVVPVLVDRCCALPGLESWRSQVVEGLRGRVVEIGFGSGLNVKHYPSAVDVVLAVEPSAVAWKLASKRLAATSVVVRHVGTDSHSLPVDDATCDAALGSFMLCTVVDPAAVVDEVYRVLRPGGAFHFLEHGLSPDPRVATWQRRLDPFQRRLADGCHLTRDAVAIVTRAGFRLERCDQGYAMGPKPWSYFSAGVGVKPR